MSKVIEDLRTENAGHRTTNRDLSAKWSKLAESVGLAKDASVEDVIGKFGEMGGTVRSMKVDREIEKAASKHKADADLVAALIVRDKVTDGIEDDKLAETLDAKVKEYVEKRPNLRLAPAAPGRSGPPIDPNDDQPKRKGLGGALDAKMGVGVGS